MAADNKSDYVYGQIRQDILTGALRPGESLSVIGIGERFNASRTPIRQAFLRLEAEGLLSLIDRQGARVAPISIQGVRDLFEVRILLEGAATRQVAEAAAQNEAAHRAFETILSELESVEGQEPSPARRDRFYELAEAYDQAIISYTRNAHLARQIAELRPHSTRLRIIAHSRPERLEVSLAEHLAMCRAIIAHNAAAAAAAASEHLTQTQRTILDAVINPDSSAVPIELVTA
jgi:DNA-binding GntR family transcriptional regulator